jgi:hypothetical protein
MNENDNTTPARTKGKALPTVGLDQDAHRHLTKSAKEFKVPKSQYASAAISYFAERGLNPVTDRQREGTVIQQRIDKRASALEQQITTLGNRLFGFLQTHEKNMYGFLQGQQKTLFSYLQKQEGSLYQYLTEQEQQLYAPMLEEIVRGATDAFIARRLGEQIVLRQQGPQAFDNNYVTVHANQTKERDLLVKQALVEIMQGNPSPAALPTIPPALTAAPAKPVAPAQPAPSAPPEAPAPRRDTY